MFHGPIKLVDHTSHTGPHWNGPHSRLVGAFAGTGKNIGSPNFPIYVAWVHGLVGNYCRKTPQSTPGQCRGSMVQSTWLTTHPTLGPIGMAHIVGSWVHLQAQVKKIGSPNFRLYVAWVHALVSNYCRKTPHSKSGQCRGSMIQSTWLTTHPTLGPIGMAHIVGSWVHLQATVKKIGSPDFRIYVAWVHGPVGNCCRKTTQSKSGQCRGSMMQSTWLTTYLTTHPTLGPIGMAHIVGWWVHLQAAKKNWLAGFSNVCGMGPWTGREFL